MQIVTIFTCLLTIVATAIVEATPLEPNHSVHGTHVYEDEHGTVTHQRVPGHWQDPAFFDSVFAETNRMLACLQVAVARYSDAQHPEAKTLLDKFYAINGHADRWEIVANFINYLATTDDLVILEDEYDDDDEAAFVSSVRVQGVEVWGIVFTRKFNNKSAKVLSGEHHRISFQAQAAILLHEAVHALSGKGNHGDHVRIDNSKKCTFLSAREFAALKKEAKDKNKPELRNQLYTVYWMQKYMTGIRKMQKHCPKKMIGVPDMTAGAGYECLYGRAGDTNKLIGLW